jgi:hypothetical protein
MPKSITIITDGFDDKLEGSRYFIAHLAKLWQRQGSDIRVSAGCNYVPANLAIMHVDTTVVGDEYLELGARYPVALNGKVKDILKTSTSCHLLKKDDSYQGPVIVKTNANYGGVNEFLRETASSNSTIPPTFIDRPWRKREMIQSLNYPIFERLADVPQGVWKNNKLIVEKFLPERLENGDYRCCVYIFFGEQEFGGWLSSPKPVIKSSNATGMGVLDQIPPALTELRKASGFNFGKFDYIEVNGEVFVYDMNKTTAFGPEILNLISDQKMNDFANEIHAFEP